MKTQRVTLITLGVDDLDRAKAFYGALGWSPAETQEGVAFYQLNGLVLGLFGRAALADDQGRPGAALGTGAMTLAQNFSTEAEVDAAFEAALAVGATALKKPEKVFWGGYSGYWADPDGHVWEVAMNPFWPLSEDGSLTLPGAMSKKDLPLGFQLMGAPGADEDLLRLGQVYQKHTNWHLQHPADLSEGKPAGRSRGPLSRLLRAR